MEIQDREITKELEESYLSYAMSVIVARALPDVRDGLKPVHRRILWDMWSSGLTHASKFRKSANVIGQVLARYHPHGDISVYDALVRMAQDFSLRYPLVQGQGNFGSIDGDSPAAYRYTEARLSRIADEMLLDIEKETVPWISNYDATREEPMVLPAKLPNLLLNGSLGIAVGMATNIPPHNLTEIVGAIEYLADNPDCDVSDLLEFVKGPDFPTGGTIFNKKAIAEAYTTGRGSVTMRAKADIEERKKGQPTRHGSRGESGGYDIIIGEIPYQVNKSELIKTMATLVTDKKIEGVRDIRDESDREGMRIVIELKNDASPQKILNRFYQHSDLQKNFNFNMIALVGGIMPQLLSLKEILVAYLVHRKEVVKSRTQFDLKKAEERAHILEGLKIALDAIDRVISTIRKSKDRDDAHANLKKNFKFSDLQSTAILEMRLQTLAALERLKIEEELKEKYALIKELKLILSSPAKMLKIIKDEVRELSEKYGDPRKTQVVSAALGEFNEEDLVSEEQAIVTFSQGGYIKRVSPDIFKSQRRGGKGLIGSDVAEEDFLTQFFAANTHDNLLFFTNKGRVFQVRAYEIPVGSRTSKGRAIHNFLELSQDESVNAIVNYSVKKNAAGGFLAMVTKDGLSKRTPLADFQNIRRNGIIAIALKKGDALKWVHLSSGNDEMLVTTATGQSIRFKEGQVRSMGRQAAGVRAIRLRTGDVVAGFDIIKSKEGQKENRLLVVTENGYAKQTPLKEYRLQSRGGSGIKTVNVTQKTGRLVSARVVSEETEIMALSQKGQMIRTELAGVRVTGRAAQGVRIMNINAGDKIAGIALI